MSGRRVEIVTRLKMDGSLELPWPLPMGEDVVFVREDQREGRVDADPDDFMIVWDFLRALLDVHARLVRLDQSAARYRDEVRDWTHVETALRVIGERWPLQRLRALGHIDPELEGVDNAPHAFPLPPWLFHAIWGEDEGQRRRGRYHGSPVKVHARSEAQDADARALWELSLSDEHPDAFDAEVEA